MRRTKKNEGTLWNGKKSNCFGLKQEENTKKTSAADF